MRRRVVVAIMVLLTAGCGEAKLLEPPQRMSTASLVAAARVAGLEDGDPYWRAVPHTGYNVFSNLPVGYEDFAADPELVSDADFASAGDALIDAAEEISYNDDGVYVEGATSSGGGGGGGGGELFAASADHCDAMYARLAVRCRRIPVARARAVCWSGAMVAYAYCRAYM